MEPAASVHCATQRRVIPLAVGGAKTNIPYLALGMITAYLRQAKAEQSLAAYEVARIVPVGCMGRPLESAVAAVSVSEDPICLLSSYVWNHDLNLQVARQIKTALPQSLIVFGGPHVPKYDDDTRDFLTENTFIDIAVIGEGEVAIVEVLEALANEPGNTLAQLHTVEGLAYMEEGVFHKTAPRTKLKGIEQLPSPYLQGEFEPWFRDFEVTVLETNRGCPYGCTYCDWGSATLSRVSKFNVDRVNAEIEYLAQQRSQTIFIADANFGMLEQDIEIARGLVHAKQRYGYPQRIMTNFAKNGGRRLMEVIKILHEGGLLPIGIIALQTTDQNVLETIARDNIKTESFEKMMEYFNSESIPMASDLMIGLPGQTVESFVNDLQYCFDWKVSANANYTSMMPNAPMAERSYREQHMIVTDENNMISASRTFTASDLDYMKKLYTAYLFHVRFGVLKYLLIYLQLEHGVRAIQLLRRWLDCALAGHALMPLSQRLLQEVFSRSVHTDWAMLIWRDNADFLFDAPENYYTEIIDFAVREFDLEIQPSVRDALIAAQQGVMPRAGRRYPHEVAVKHDFAAYIEQVKRSPSLHEVASSLQPLATFGPAALAVFHDSEVIENNRFLEPGTHADAWELPSPLRFY
jgi:radical SAM superfamily enzyme YgiQ (UPF0313 family)